MSRLVCEWELPQESLGDHALMCELPEGARDEMLYKLKAGYGVYSLALLYHPTGETVHFPRDMTLQ